MEPLKEWDYQQLRELEAKPDVLSIDSNFALFLADGVTWGKRAKAKALRGFTDRAYRKQNT